MSNRIESTFNLIVNEDGQIVLRACTVSPLIAESGEWKTLTPWPRKSCREVALLVLMRQGEEGKAFARAWLEGRLEFSEEKGFTIKESK